MNKSLLKKIKKGENSNALQDVLREVAILKRLRHPNVVRMYEIIDDPTNDKLFIGMNRKKLTILLVMEFIENGPIMKLDSKDLKASETLPESKARKYLLDIVNGLEYCTYFCLPILPFFKNSTFSKDYSSRR